MKRLLIILLLLITILIGGCQFDGVGIGFTRIKTEIHGEKVDENAPFAFVLFRPKDKEEGKK